MLERIGAASNIRFYDMLHCFWKLTWKPSDNKQIKLVLCLVSEANERLD